MNNIFKYAYFGKTYKTRDGREVIYCGTFDNDSKFNTKMVINTDPDQSSDYIEFIWYTQEGKASPCSGPHPDDIISEWEESITEEELNDIAKRWVDENSGCWDDDDGIDAFIAGYKFAFNNEK